FRRWSITLRCHRLEDWPHHRRLLTKEVLVRRLRAGRREVAASGSLQVRPEARGVELIAAGLCFGQGVFHEPDLNAPNRIGDLAVTAKVHVRERGRFAAGTGGGRLTG